MKYAISIFCFLNLFASCTSKTETNNSKANNQILKYTKLISAYDTKDSVFIISANEKLAFLKKDLPLKKVMIIPTSALSYMEELGLTSKITGISQPDFIYNPKIKELYSQNKIEQIGSFNELFVEKILISPPDLLVSTSGPALAKFHQLLSEKGIKILFIDEYDELNPLARAEYVKVFGLLFGKEKKAKTLFDEIEKNYKEIENKIAKANKTRPTVFANQIYGDIWYMPGGKSFQSQLFKDAGAEYLWENNPAETSLTLSFETVFEKAYKADYWLNAGDYPDLKSLVSAYKNYDWFEAVKNKKVYNWNKRSNSKGANDYFETGTARPDMVLSDLASIFYPELFPDHKLFFYKKLE